MTGRAAPRRFRQEERMPHVTHHIAARRGTALVLAFAAALCALALAAQPSHAGVLTASAPECPQPPSSQVFRPWLDIAKYQPAPDGGFEAGATGWDLDGATVVAGNEPYDLGGAPAASGLPLPPG